jgi:serine/threonine protein phosphatase PrpC
MSSIDSITLEMQLHPAAETPLAVVEQAAVTDRGRQRARNEDAYLADPPVFAVADGVGGSRGGQIAARLAVRELAAVPLATLAGADGLAAALRAANARVHAAGETVAAYAGMGTTLTAAVVVQDEVRVAHVGDSRLYRIRDGRMNQLTRDHTFFEELIGSGRFERSPGCSDDGDHRWRSILSRAVGLEAEVAVDAMTYPGAPGDLYVLCSDGLTKALSDEQIRDTIARSPTLSAATGALVASANSHGGRDNVTVVMFRLAPGEPSPAAPPGARHLDASAA